MSINSRSKGVRKEGKYATQPANETEVNTITLGDMALEKAVRNQNRHLKEGAQ
ncbi:hypothetical protein ACFFHM_02035 [Halalkalibacter kiskunsagensis]|uniref:Transposase n=1 Tax=Halalkalibacter kiskunsagensis TaxID=1548599 RepID=A0ABV6K7Q9_9BACI